MSEHRLPASLTPHPAVILAVDPGQKSGWAIFVGGELRDFGKGDTRDARLSSIVKAIRLESATNMRLVIVGESWTASRNAKADKRMNARTLAGLGASWGLWLAAIEQAGFPKRRVIRCPQIEWKRAIVGSAYASHDTAIATVKRRHKVEGSDDEMAAIAIGEWATRAARVGALMPKVRAKRARAA